MTTSDSKATAAAEWRNYWSLPLAAALGYGVAVVHIYSIGSFIAPLQHQFGWSRAQTSGGLTVAAGVTALFCIPIGILVDRIGPRRMGLFGILALPAAFALLSTATGTTTNWLALWGLIAIASVFMHATVWTSAVATRFERSRGLAFAVTLSGSSLCATVIPMLATWLIGEYGWRNAFMALAGICAAVTFPVLLLCFRGANDVGREQRAAAELARGTLHGISLSEGMRSSALYKLLLAGGLFAFTIIGITVHFVPILTDQGAQPLAAAGTASLIGIFSIIGRLGSGVVLDRFPGHRVGAVVFVIPIVACVLLLSHGANPVCQMIAAAIFGLTVGSEVDVIAYLAAKHFGLRNFGALYGTLVMALALGTAFGPLAAGSVFDHYGSYQPFLMLTAIMMGVSAIVLLTLGSPPSRASAASAQLT